MSVIVSPRRLSHKTPIIRSPKKTLKNIPKATIEYADVASKGLATVLKGIPSEKIAETKKVLQNEGYFLPKEGDISIGRKIIMFRVKPSKHRKLVKILSELFIVKL
jgi:hypothetical protein